MVKKPNGKWGICIYYKYLNKMKLNPNKCMFGVESMKFLGYIIN